MVAPTSTMVPSSITGRKPSCCARLKRWISSTNSSVPCPVSRRARACLEHLLQVGDAGEDRRDLLEMQVGRLRQQPRHRGLAGAGRAPEDQRAERARRQHAGERAVGPEQMVLADDLGELSSAAACRRAGAARPGRGRRRRTGSAPARFGARASSAEHRGYLSGRRADGDAPAAGSAAARSARSRSRGRARSSRR